MKSFESLLESVATVGRVVLNRNLSTMSCESVINPALIFSCKTGLFFRENSGSYLARLWRRFSLWGLVGQAKSSRSSRQTVPKSYSFPLQKNPIVLENKKKRISELFSHKFSKILDNLFFIVFHTPWQHKTFVYDTEQREHYPSVSLYYYWENRVRLLLILILTLIQPFITSHLRTIKLVSH